MNPITREEALHLAKELDLSSGIPGATKPFEDENSMEENKDMYPYGSEIMDYTPSKGISSMNTRTQQPVGLDHSTPAVESNNSNNIQNNSVNMSDIQIDALQRRLQELELDISERDKHIQALERDKEKQNSEIIELQSKFKEVKDGFVSKEQLHELQNSYDSEKACKNTLNERIIVLTAQLDSYKDELTDYKTSYNNLKELNESTKNKHESFASYIKNLTLFGINIGHAITLSYRDNINEFTLDTTFKMSNPNITKFFKKDDEISLKNSEMLSSIMSHDSEILDKLAKLEVALDETKGEQKKIDESKDEIIKKIEYNSQEILRKLEKCDQTEDFQLKLVEIQENISALLKGNQDKILISLKDIQKVNESFGSQISELKKELKKEKDKHTELTEKLNKLRGDSSELLTFKDFKNSDIDKRLYQALQVDKVEQLDLVQLQNKMKKVIVDMQTPLDKLDAKLPLANLLIKSELVITLDFINRLYQTMYNEGLDFNHYTEEAYLQYRKSNYLDPWQHPIRPIIDHLYNDIIDRLH
ncbi:hypothetical protein KAFR_0A07940 [Kazachstania africana CBS 2517]|uniref:Uncharacterized protein n=1 Tax=Kazachstania africana (strain ATCC 22294 / BCRC 22015 / CBS 2517 / CECT 1963 / NBRC 1671 / NRRL Y-8276) TaxID=1071382 RepID=H2APC8_KAZAF|nr:hypothetical protein KAFR_0A07940 [Kazachstania africana CBS 2517]CCF56228.1 hypothetical protein KAFR_0A07940 [Kazachstania africana CBS 2517]